MDRPYRSYAITHHSHPPLYYPEAHPVIIEIKRKTGCVQILHCVFDDEFKEFQKIIYRDCGIIVVKK